MACPLAFLSGLPGGGEIILLFLAILVLFGAKRLPGIARSMGSLLAQLRRASDDFKDQIMKMDADPVETPQDAIDVDSDTSVSEVTDKEDEGADE